MIAHTIQSFLASSLVELRKEMKKITSLRICSKFSILGIGSLSKSLYWFLLSSFGFLPIHMQRVRLGRIKSKKLSNLYQVSLAVEVSKKLIAISSFKSLSTHDIIES